MADLDQLDLPAPPGIWRDLGWPCLAGAIATAVIGVGVLFASLAAGLAAPRAAMLTLFAVTFGIALAAGPLAAGARTVFGAIGRAGALADASIVVLFALARWGGGVIGWSQGWRLYVLWVMLAMLGASAVCLARSRAGRANLAIAASCLLTLAMAGLFWSPGLLAALDGPGRQAALSAILAVNPLMSVVSLTGPAASFNWFVQPVMYDIARANQDYPVPPTWWAWPAVLWGGAAALLLLAVWTRTTLRRWLFGA